MSRERYNDFAVLQDHVCAPRNMGRLDTYNGFSRVTGPCGDTVEFAVDIQNDRVLDISFMTDGCGMSTAAGSMTSCLADDKKLMDVFSIRPKHVDRALASLPKDHFHCAQLAVGVLHDACESYLRMQVLLAVEEAKGVGTNEANAQVEEARSKLLQAKLSRIENKYIVLSGKGGVGKSTIAVNTAFGLMMRGYRVGILDADLHGPSVPTMLGIDNKKLNEAEQELWPIELGKLKVVSVGFLLSSFDEALIWRGPRKFSVLKQFLSDVHWGDLDYLIVDCPPGTGDEVLAVCQLMGKVDGAVVVTAPQKVADIDVRKSVSFCDTLQVPIIGIIENMNGFRCPTCGEVSNVFGQGVGHLLAQEKGVPFLGSIPIDPQISETSDQGRCVVHHYPDAPASEAITQVVEAVLKANSSEDNAKQQELSNMRIAVPLAGDKLAEHFGHCDTFALIDVDSEKKELVARLNVDAPPHQPGLLPGWLAEKGAEVVIAGGMGQRASDLLSEQGIRVVLGAERDTAENIVMAFLSDNLKLSANRCDH